MKAIYGILNKLNGHQYVGSTINFYKRKKLHLKQLEEKIHHSRYLQSAWDKYRKEMFEFIILEHIENKEDLIPREQWWIDNSNSEYNVCRIAGSTLGIKRTEETKEKLRLVNLGLKHPEWRNKIKSLAQGGENHHNYGKKLSEETIYKKSASMKEYFKNHPPLRLGVKLSKEIREKMNSYKSIPIIQLSLDDKFIKEWKSIAEANKIGGFSPSTIIRSCKGRTKIHKKFKWIYKINN